ncbi:MAG TPA: 4'-phosphopantetheinyl transferase superfamily protein [Blastocatellia bacterium]|nr:4'-phosphopantetheinyl transferase superfamily protein [Blastocatellia bacterium]
MTDAPQVWRLPPDEPLQVTAQEVHVWRGALDQPPPVTEQLLATMTADERRRAGRYHFARDREHFIVARGMLRAILGRYLGRGPGDLQFIYAAYGKPALSTEPSHGGLRFNLSHSHGLALLAVTRDREVGVDLEFIRPGVIEEEIAEHFFSAAEVRLLRALPPAEQAEAFFNCWTRKEAYIKARGEGLSLPLDQFEVSLAPGQPAELRRTAGDKSEAGRWTMRELFPGSAFKAALAVAGPECHVKCWQWIT